MMPLVVFGGCISRNWDNFVATVSLVLVAWLYSVPPMRLKERPPLDSLANGLGYFLLPFAMGYSLGADIRTMPLRYYFSDAVRVRRPRAGHRGRLRRRPSGRASHDGGRIRPPCGRRFAFAAFLDHLAVRRFSDAGGARLHRVCTLATLVGGTVSADRVILAACVTIFAGFLIAAACDIAGL